MRRSRYPLYVLAAASTLACTVPNPNAQSSDASESTTTDADTSATETETGSGTSDEGETGPNCDEGLTDCNGDCVDLQDDDDHCSACDLACGAGWSCTQGACHDARSWAQPLRADDDDTLDASEARLAVAANGDAFVGFMKVDPVSMNAAVRVARMPTDAVQWGIPEPVDQIVGGQWDDFDMKLDGEGTLIALWSDNYANSPMESVYVARWDTGEQSWQTAEAAASLDSLRYPTLATDDTGSAAIAWVEVGDTKQVRAIRWDTVTTDWTAPEEVQVPASNLIDASSIRIAAHDSSYACTWFENENLDYGSYAAVFNPNDQWLNAMLVSDFDGSAKLNTNLRFDDEGNLVSIWRQGLERGNTLRARVRAEGQSDWSEPTDLEITAAGDVDAVDVWVSGTQAYAVWNQDDGTRSSVWFAIFDLTSATWSDPEAVDPDATDDAYAARVHATPDGHAQVVWFNDDFGDGTNGQLMARQRHTGTGWNDAVTIEVVGGGLSDLQLDDDAAGNLMAAWRTAGGDVSEVWTAAFQVQP